MKVKICGMTREEDVRLACGLGAWAVGLVFAPGPRTLTLEKAKLLRREVAQGVLAVGVFQDAPRGEIEKAVSECRLDAIQLHGAESPEDCRGYRVPVFKVLPPGADEATVAGYEVQAVLVEPVRTIEERRRGLKPSVAAQRAAWEAARRLKGRFPMVIVAGGLDPENVAQAAATAGPDAVDVSSGVESSPGAKDPRKLEAFFNALKG